MQIERGCTVGKSSMSIFFSRVPLEVGSEQNAHIPRPHETKTSFRPTAQCQRRRIQQPDFFLLSGETAVAANPQRKEQNQTKSSTNNLPRRGRSKTTKLVVPSILIVLIFAAT
jgi:hypothetical protein